MSEYRISYISATVEVAEQIAHTLVVEGLAACVNIVDKVRSIYRWQGQVEKAAESLLIVKGATAKTKALIERVREIHPYEVPEIVCFDIDDGNQDYLDWLGGKEIVVDDSALEEDEEVEAEPEAES